MSRPLMLSKIVLVNESPDIISDQKEEALLNPDDFAKNLFFKIKSGSEVIYDQMELAQKDLSGNVL